MDTALIVGIGVLVLIMAILGYIMTRKKPVPTAFDRELLFAKEAKRQWTTEIVLITLVLLPIFITVMMNLFGIQTILSWPIVLQISFFMAVLFILVFGVRVLFQKQVFDRTILITLAVLIIVTAIMAFLIPGWVEGKIFTAALVELGKESMAIIGM